MPLWLAFYLVAFGLCAAGLMIWLSWDPPRSRGGMP